MTSDSFISFKRVFRTVPSIDTANERTGVNFVDILFGLVVTSAAVAFARELVDGWAKDSVSIDETRLAHLLVAITLTVLSWIGYHQSQQRPPFQIKFVNFPLLQFGLDVLMVVTYYVVVRVAENANGSNGPSIDASVRPEALLIAFAFSLYFAWDWLGWRVFRDAEYAAAIDRPPRTPFTDRRWVTVAFTLLAIVALAVAYWWNPRSTGAVIGFDAFLVLFLVAYRFCKPLFDRRATFRDEVQAPVEVDT